MLGRRFRTYRPRPTPQWSIRPDYWHVLNHADPTCALTRRAVRTDKATEGDIMRACLDGGERRLLLASSLGEILVYRLEFLASTVYVLPAHMHTHVRTRCGKI